MKRWNLSSGKDRDVVGATHPDCHIEGEMEALWNQFCVISAAVSSPLFVVSSSSPALCICKNSLTEAFSSKRCWDLFYQIMLQPCLTWHMRKEETSLKTFQTPLCATHTCSHCWRTELHVVLTGLGPGEESPHSHCQAAQGRAGFPWDLPSLPSTHRALWVFITKKKRQTWPQDLKSKALSYKPCWKSGTLLKCRNSSGQNMAIISKMYNCFSWSAVITHINGFIDSGHRKC